MSRAALPALIGLAVLLGGALAAEIALDGSDAGLPQAAARTAALPAAAPAPGSADVQGWAATILERPLFAPDRRPVSTAAPSAAIASEGLPRLAGVVVTPDGRRAIFATGSDGKQITLAENGRIGVFTVSRIDADAVTVAGPDGSRLLHPSFATGAAAVAKAPPPAAASLPPPSNAPSGLDLLQSSRKFPIPAASKQ